MTKLISLIKNQHAQMTFERYCSILKIILALLALLLDPLAMTRTPPPSNPIVEMDRNSYQLLDHLWTDERGNRFEAGSAVHSTARLGRENQVMPYAVIGPATSIGDGNRIEPFAIVGAAPQTRRGDGGLTLGNGNTVHGHATISRGVGGDTTIGDDCLFMATSHVGHDCSIRNGVTLGNGATLAGHVTVDDGAIIGAYSTVIQHSYVGSLAHVLPQLACRKSLLPGETFDGSGSARINTIGIRRAGGTIVDVRAIRMMLNDPSKTSSSEPGIADFLAAALRRWEARSA